jgi:hypothetical protein
LRDGKQIAFPKEASYSFFSFDYINGEEDRNVRFTFRACFDQFQQYDGREINTRLYAAGSESRMDGQVKAFIRDELNAQVNDLIIFKTKGTKNIDFEFMFVPKSNKLYYPLLLKLTNSENHSVFSFEEQLKDKLDVNAPLQQIFYGAPGTGKSHCIKDDANVKEADEKNLVFRTTFHPDSDYSTFVGAYKPTMKPVADKYKAVAGKDEEITYSFIPQAFLQAYVAAWNNPDDKVFLVIEEINRGNCAQIFGDLFQLLDRDENGWSEYPIMADKDLAKFLKGNDEEGQPVLTNKDGIKDGKLCLPKNLHIWATMNTSDQSLFPIDSAFKRRWDWVYMPIHDGRKGWQIEVDGKRYDWWQFVDAMNDKIGTATYSEDKKLGYFFCKAKDGVIDAETFVGKVVFYIWNDVFKDFAEEAGNLFKDVDGSMLSFNKFYTIGTDGKRMVVEPKIAILMQNLGVEPIITSNSTNDDEPEEDEDGNNPSSYNKNYDKFSVNGEGKWGKNRLPYECLKKYVEMNPGLNADEVLNNWKSLNVNVPHFVESKEEYESRTDNSKRSYYVKCGDTIIYVAHNGYGSNGKVYEFIAAINNANWGIKLAKVMA